MSYVFDSAGPSASLMMSICVAHSHLFFCVDDGYIQMIFLKQQGRYGLVKWLLSLDRGESFLQQVDTGLVPTRAFRFELLSIVFRFSNFTTVCGSSSFEFVFFVKKPKKI